MVSVNFHGHTHYSDGSDSATAYVDRLVAAGVKYAAITDHDTLGGVNAALAHSKGRINLFSGVEVSTSHLERYDVHILGINVKTNIPGSEQLFEANNVERAKRTKGLIKMLNRTRVLNATEEEIIAYYNYPGYVISSLHVMDYLVFAEGCTFDQARNIVIGAEQSFPKRYSKMLSIEQGMKAINTLEGIAVLAHPGEYEKQIDGNENEKREALLVLLCKLKEMGLKGLEVFHPKHSPKQIQEYMEIAEKMQLAVSAGGDYHGRHKLLQAISWDAPIYDLLKLLGEK